MAKKNKEDSPKIPMFGYKVEIKKQILSSKRGKGSYGSWSKKSEQTISRMASKTDEYPDVVSSLDIPQGSNALVVWAIWGSGDSFGKESGANAEVIGIFTDMKSAQELVSHIESRNSYGNKDSWKNNEKLDFTTSDGQHFECGFVGWGGYFESLENVRIDVVSIF